MDPFGIGITGLGAAGAATFGAFGLAFRSRRRRLAAQASEAAIDAALPPTGDEPAGLSRPGRIRRLRPGRGGNDGGSADRDRIEAIATAQAELALRLDALAAAGSAPEERLQAMAGQLLGLIRDKNATLETAMAGLDQLRARMKALEELGEPAEARGLFEGLRARMGELETRSAASAAALEARLAALASGGGASELAERLARLHEGRDAGLEAALGRLAPLETRLAGLESGIGAGREASRRLEAALAALQGEQASARTEIAALRAVAEAAPARAEAKAEAVRAELGQRIDAFERAMAARDPQGVLDRFAERLTAVQDRLGLIEAAENPLAGVSATLAQIHAQKEAAVEAVLARLGPLEARLAAFERETAARDPRAAIEQLASRLEAVAGRLTLVETAEDPLAEISATLAGLHAQKDLAVETVLARLAPVEARLGGIEREIAAQDPQGALDRFAERLEAVAGRVSRIEAAPAPLAEISERLAGLHAQKEAAVEAVLARLAPLEAKLAGVEAGLLRAAEEDPRPAVEGLRAQVESLHRSLGDTTAGLAALRAEAAAGTGFAEVADRLTELFARKEAGLAAVLERLGPLEAALERVAALEGVLGRLGPLEAALGRLGPLETRLAALEGRDDPEAARRMADEVAADLAALRADAAAQTALFADRLALLEAGLPRLDARQAARMRGEGGTAAPATPEAAMPGEVPPGIPSGIKSEAAPDADPEEAIWALPRIISLHK